MTPQKRAVIYVRVSGRKQDEEMQLPDCRKYCADHGFKIVDEIADKMTGASVVAKRPGGKQVYDLMERGAVDVVVMWVLDRVARDQQVTEYVVFKRDVRSYGVELHFTDKGATSDDPYQSIVEYAEAAGAAAERLRIIKRTTTGRRVKFVERGRLVLNGEPAFGYRKIGIQREADLIIDDVEGPIVRDIFVWYVRDRLSLWEILKRVSGNGVKPRRSEQWNKRRLIHLLHYPGYKGVFQYSEHTMVKSELAIVDPETWETAQTILKGNQWIKSRNGSYLLAGRVRCTCENMMTGSAGDGKLYYRCHKGESYPAGSPERCHDMRRFRVDRLDKIAWGWLTMLAMSPGGFNRIIDDMRRNLETEIAPLRNRIESLEELIKERDDEMKRQVKRIAKQKDKRAEQLMQDELDSLAESRLGLITQRDKAQSELDRYGFLVNGSVDPALVRRRLNHILKCHTQEEKRRSIEEFDVRAQFVRVDGVLKLKMSCYLVPGGEIMELDENNPYGYVIGAVFDEDGTASGSF